MQNKKQALTANKGSPKKICSMPKRSTFLIKVLYVQNASIQGIIQWIDEDKIIPFRSFMELIHLLEEGVMMNDEIKDLRSWKDDWRFRDMLTGKVFLENSEQNRKRP